MNSEPEHTVTGLLVGTLLGAGGAVLFGMSDFNPDAGGPLSLSTHLILAALPVIGAVLGYAAAQAVGHRKPR